MAEILFNPVQFKQAFMMAIGQEVPNSSFYKIRRSAGVELTQDEPWYTQEDLEAMVFIWKYLQADPNHKRASYALLKSTQQTQENS